MRTLTGGCLLRVLALITVSWLVVPAPAPAADVYYYWQGSEHWYKGDCGEGCKAYFAIFDKNDEKEHEDHNGADSTKWVPLTWDVPVDTGYEVKCACTEGTPEPHDYDKVVIDNITVIKPEVEKLTDKNGDELAGTIDVKTAEKPIYIHYKIVGASEELTVANAKINIRYDDDNDAHKFLYGEDDKVVRVLEENNPARIEAGTNKYKMEWEDGCSKAKEGDDDEETKRLLLAGDFRFEAEVTVQEISPSPVSGRTCKSDPLEKTIAEPRAGHFCGDWPRASVYEPNGIDEDCIKSGKHDENAGDDIRPMLKDAHDDDDDGGWWYLIIHFKYKNVIGKWLTYTGSFDPDKTKKKKDNPGTENTFLNVTKIYGDQADISRYPQATRRAIVARWVAEESKWQMYWVSDPFTGSSTYHGYLTVGDAPVYLTDEGTAKLSYDGSRNADGSQKWDLTVSLTAPTDPSSDGAERGLFLLPIADGISGKYNDAANTKYFVEVHISGFSAGADRAFNLECHRGYGSRKFWNVDCEGNTCGVNIHGGITDTNGYDSVHYNAANPKDTNDYGNRTDQEAPQKWEDLLGLMEFATHGYSGGVGWYWRVYETGEDDDTLDELFDEDHKEWIKTLELPGNLDDILLAVLGGCHTADAPSGGGDSMTTAVSDSGVDAVLGWTETQYKSRHLFVKYFFSRAYEKECTAYAGEDTYPVEWTNYPTVREACTAAYHDLVAAIGTGGGPDWSNAEYVYGNLVIDGAGGEAAAEKVKMYPPRYGAKDK